MAEYMMLPVHVWYLGPTLFFMDKDICSEEFFASELYIL